MALTKNKNGMMSLVTLALIIVVGIVLLTTLTNMSKSTFKAVTDLFDYQYTEFEKITDTLFNPSIPEYLKTWWLQDYGGFIRSAIGYKTGPVNQDYSYNSCIGSFSVPLDQVMRGVQLSFVQVTDGINIFLRDSKNVVGVYDKETIKDTPSVKWHLCIVDPEKAQSFGGSLTNQINTGQNSLGTEFLDRLKKDISSVKLELSDNKGDVKATYYSIAHLQDGTPTASSTPEKFNYESWKMPNQRYVYLFMVLKGETRDGVQDNYFCIVPTVNKEGDGGVSTNQLNDALKQKMTTKDSSGKVSTNLYIDDANTLFCNVPKGDDPQNDFTAYRGHRSCYYYSCEDVQKAGASAAVDNLCVLWFKDCPTVCTYVNGGIFSTAQCGSCNEVKKCEDYYSVEACTSDLCRISDCANAQTSVEKPSQGGNCMTGAKAKQWYATHGPQLVPGS